MNTFKAPVTVWIGSHSSHDAASLQDATDCDGMVVWAGSCDFGGGYTKVGEGVATITIDNRDQIMAGKAESLRAELERDRAESQKRQTELMRKISELEALTYEAAQ
jgi:hypothetical protein